MKKRLLAMAMCLVMVVSLLPLTAAAAFPSSSEMRSWAGGIKHDGTYCGDIYITDASPEGFQITEVTGAGYFLSVPAASLGDGQWKLPASDEINTVSVVFSDASTGANLPLDFSITSKYSHTWSAWTSNGNGTHSRTCGNGCVDSPQTKDCADTSPADCKCDDCGASMHTWQFTRTDSTLTGTCQKSTCPIKEVSVSLKADSVTLPNSPFNARLEGWNDFQAATGAEKTDIVYKCNGVEVSDGSTPKAGNYQAWVMIKNLRGPVYQDGVAAFADSQDTTSTAELFVQYTAVDPAVTAQTGDNRPIELMMMGVVLFSALAAAAFILDNKRKYSR